MAEPYEVPETSVKASCSTHQSIMLGSHGDMVLSGAGCAGSARAFPRRQGELESPPLHRHLAQFLLAGSVNGPVWPCCNSCSVLLWQAKVGPTGLEAIRSMMMMRPPEGTQASCAPLAEL